MFFNDVLIQHDEKKTEDLQNSLYYDFKLKPKNMKKITLAFLMLFTGIIASAQTQCEFQLELNDSFGDGWNDNSIDVLVNGMIVLDDATLDDGAQGFESFMVTDGDEISITIDDSGAFVGEVSYRILNNVGASVAEGDLTVVPDAFEANCLDCTPGMAEVQLFGDCANGEFSFVINMLDLGDASSFTVTTNYNAQMETITETGATLSGPLPVAAANLIVTLTPEDADCTLVFEIPIPCPPANNTCDTAEGLGDGEVFMQNIGAATEDETGCGPTGAPSVWFFVDDQGTPTEVTVSTAGSDFDTIIASITGDCDNQVCGEINDDANGTVQSELTFTTPGNGERVYIVVLGFLGATGNLQMNVTGDGLLSTDIPTQLDGFKMYPNPTTDIINVANNASIQNVQVYNLLGQKVLDQTINGTSEQINVSTLQSGSYLLQVTSEGQTGTYKFIKQ